MMRQTYSRRQLLCWEIGNSFGKHIAQFAALMNIQCLQTGRVGESVSGFVMEGAVQVSNWIENFDKTDIFLEKTRKCAQKSYKICERISNALDSFRSQAKQVVEARARFL